MLQDSEVARNRARFRRLVYLTEEGFLFDAEASNFRKRSAGKMSEIERKNALEKLHPGMSGGPLLETLSAPPGVAVQTPIVLQSKCLLKVPQQLGCTRDLPCLARTIERRTYDMKNIFVGNLDFSAT